MNMKYYQKQYECMPLDELKKLQGERLAKNFRHVYENVEYYRKRCQEAGVTPDDVKGLEDLDKIYVLFLHKIFQPTGLARKIFY